MSKQPILFDNGTFSKDGIKYVLDVRIQYNIDGKDYGVSLSRNHIDDLEISTQLDKLFSSGFIVYDDVQGDISRINGVFNAVCMVQFMAYKQEGDGGFNAEVQDQTQSFSHSFIVENIEIVQSGTDYIRYCIHLTGTEYYQLMNNVQYSDYGKDDQKTFAQLVKKMLSDYGKLETDKSFQGDVGGVTLNYITNGNDTVQSTIDYLMQKQFFYKEKNDDRISMVVYDMYSRKYGLFSVTSNFKPSKMYTLFISMNDSNLSEFISSERVVLASNSYVRKTQALRAISEISFRDYSIESNQFEKKTRMSSMLARFFGGDDTKLVPISNYGQTNLRRDYSEWDNDSNIYKDFLDVFMGWDSILVDTGGIIGRKLLDIVNLAFDNRTELKDTSTKQADEQLTRYKQLQGGWYITKIRYIIKASRGIFTQNLQLSRTMNMK